MGSLIDICRTLNSNIFLLCVLGFSTLNCIIYRGPSKRYQKVSRRMEEKEARRLVESYTDMIMRIGTNYLKSTTDAEDICQAVLVKYITSDPQFDSPEHEKAWVIITTINMCKNELKSAFFKKTTALEEADYVKAFTPPDLGITEEVMKLPRNYRISIYLFYYEGYSAKEIAELLGKKESAINMYLSRGRKKLKLSIMNDLDIVSRLTVRQGE